MEDINLRRVMETSDLPKLSRRFNQGNSFALIAWNLYKERILWVYNKASFKKIYEITDDSNPLITLFTWSVMAPVGGTFCCNVIYSIWLVFNYNDV